MKFSDRARQAAAEYMHDAKLPNTFTKDITKKFRMLVTFMFHMELEGVEQKDLSKKDMELLLDIEVLKPYVNESLYKECVKNARLVKIEKETTKSKGKSKCKHKHDSDTVVYIRRRSRAAKWFDDAKDLLMEGALEISLRLNNVLN